MLWILKDLGLSRMGGARLGGYSLKWVRRYTLKKLVSSDPLQIRPLTVQ